MSSNVQHTLFDKNSQFNNTECSSMYVTTEENLPGFSSALRVITVRKADTKNNSWTPNCRKVLLTQQEKQHEEKKKTKKTVIKHSYNP